MNKLTNNAIALAAIGYNLSMTIILLSYIGVLTIRAKVFSKPGDKLYRGKCGD